MGISTTRQAALLRACAIAGDEAAFARKLGIPLDEAVSYLLGERPIPVDVFLIAVDMVLADSKATVKANRALLAAIRERHQQKRR